MKKSNNTPKSNGSVGRIILELFSKSIRLMDNGVKKTIRSKRLSSEKTKRRIITKTTGSNENQKNSLAIKMQFNTMKIAHIP
jgi:hypothetical protein